MTHILRTVSGADVDEFAAYDFSEFTEEDLAQIDAEIARKHLPKVAIAYEVPSGARGSRRSSPSKRRKTRDSPLDLFRPYGTLSVTDLVSPSWCEVQFEYGLRGKRSWPLCERPRSFKSASGKEIKTNARVAVKNDVITSRGKAIHKSLEREVKSAEVTVEITGVEEKWALRLVNMLACLKGMQLEGMTREVPVFGIEDGEIIVGIIDELGYQPRAKDQRTTALSEMENYSDPLGFLLQIIDTKTRKHASLPPAEDMIPSRLQLMLYHRLLSGLVSSEPPFDFMVFWQLANVDPERQLSWRFLEQAGLIADNGDFQVLTLADLSVLWHDLVHQLHIAGVDDQLKLIYRLQFGGECRNEPTPPKGSSIYAEASSPGEHSCQTTNKDRILAHSSPVLAHVAVDIDDSFAFVVPELGTLGKRQYQILGTKTFQYNSQFLSLHLNDALTWWRGQRRPRGVPVELARRCNTCEYHDDCEWREEQAKELREQAKLNEVSGSVFVIE